MLDITARYGIGAGESPQQVQQLYLFGYSNPKESAWPWLSKSVITQSFGVNKEEGVDLGMQVGTPITSLTEGTVVGVGYYKGGGVVSVESLVKGKMAAVYYQHLDLINGPVDAQFGQKGPIKLGYKVRQLEVIGWSGGQLQGGHHPSAGPPYSTGPHIEVGYNAPYGGLWNPHHLTPSENPVPWLQAIAAEGPGGTPVGQGIAGAIKWASTVGPSFLPLAEALDDAELFPGFDPRPDSPLDIISIPLQAVWENAPALALRMLIIMIGVLIFIIGLWQLIRPALHAVESEVSRATGAVLGTNSSYMQGKQEQAKLPQAGFDTTGLIPGTPEYEAARTMPAREREGIADRIAAQAKENVKNAPQRLNTGMLRGTPAAGVGA